MDADELTELLADRARHPSSDTGWDRLAALPAAELLTAERQVSLPDGFVLARLRAAAATAHRTQDGRALATAAELLHRCADPARATAAAMGTGDRAVIAAACAHGRPTSEVLRTMVWPDLTAVYTAPVELFDVLAELPSVRSWELLFALEQDWSATFAELVAT